MKLKHEHKIYKKDFNSKEKMQKAYLNLQKAAEETYDEIKKLSEHHYDYLDNSDDSEKYKDELEEMKTDAADVASEFENNFHRIK